MSDYSQILSEYKKTLFAIGTITDKFVNYPQILSIHFFLIFILENRPNKPSFPVLNQSGSISIESLNNVKSIGLNSSVTIDKNAIPICASSDIIESDSMLQALDDLQKLAEMGKAKYLEIKKIQKARACLKGYSLGFFIYCLQLCNKI